MYQNLYIHSSLKGFPESFQFWLMINKCAKNFHVQVLVRTCFSNHLNKYLGAQSLHCVVGWFI